MIYGANGYAGQLIAREAAHRGWRPTLAGRSEQSIAKLATELDCPSRVFSLDDRAGAIAALGGMHTVLNCAGPFIATAGAMLDACLTARVNYLDITGEIEVIEHAAGLHDGARAAGISIIPAVGFDVVPSDCLAAMLAAELPTATRLELAFTAGAISRGTARTMIEWLPYGGRARIDGQIRRVPIAWKTIEVPFSSGRRSAVSIPWGDVASAFYSTGIPNIDCFVAMSRTRIRWLRRLRWLFPLLRITALRKLLERVVKKRGRDPSAAERDQQHAELWGRVSDSSGQTAEATLVVPSGYKLTVLTALAACERVLAGDAPKGFATPSQAFGMDFIREICGEGMRLTRIQAQ